MLGEVCVRVCVHVVCVCLYDVDHFGSLSVIVIFILDAEGL